MRRGQYQAHMKTASSAVASAHMRAEMAPHMNCTCGTPEEETCTILTELRPHGLLSRWNISLSSEQYTATNLGTACAAAFLHCLETQAQSTIARASKKLRTVMCSSRGSAPAQGLCAVRVASRREEWSHAACPTVISGSCWTGTSAEHSELKGCHRQGHTALQEMPHNTQPANGLPCASWGSAVARTLPAGRLSSVVRLWVSVHNLHCGSILGGCRDSPRLQFAWAGPGHGPPI